MKKKLLHLLLNQYFLSAIISLVIIYFLPNYFTKYKIELKSENNASKAKIYFEDLNNDAKSELIICRKNTSGMASFVVKNEKGLLINQWNFSTKLLEGSKFLSFLDIDKNGSKEIYLLTQKTDSVFLNIIEPFIKNGIQKKLFIDVLKDYNEESFLWGSEIIENNKEVLFTLNAGFGGAIRNAYKYNFNSNEVTKSPHLTNRSSIDQIVDINNDGLNEIIMMNYAACNKIDSIYTKLSDCSLWLTVLNNNFEFQFEPVEFNNSYSSLYVTPLKSQNEDKILCLVVSRGSESQNSSLNIYSNNGEKLKEKILPLGQYLIFQKKSLNTFLLHDSNTGLIQEFNTKLEEINSFFIKTNSDLYEIDIDNDGKKEWISIATNKNNITIYREDFSNPISFITPFERTDNLSFGLKQLNRTKNELYFQKNDLYAIYNYFKNPYYSFRFLIYLGIFFIIFGLVWLIAKGQKIRLERQLNLEREIAQLQIKTIKNQVDPHFVFNAINTISEMTLTDNKLEVDNFICKFSDLMRKTLKGSDKIEHSLQEELNYVENFIQLQQIRFQHSFQHKINSDQNISLETNVPKHILYSYVENAIKHGLSNKTNGFLNINILRKHKNLIITIEDNGGGLNKSRKTKRNSTGNGLLIMEKIYAMYFKLYKQKIAHSISEVIDEKNNIKGIKIEVIIKNKFKY